MKSDIEMPVDLKVETVEKESFPPPKHVFTIHSPLVHIVPACVQDSLESASIRMKWSSFLVSMDGSSNAFSFSGASATAPKKKRLKLKMAVLITKMINGLIEDKVIAYDRVNFSTTTKGMSVQILAGAKTVPILILRCERLGIGSVVGSFFVSPVEFAEVPDPSPEKQALVFPIPDISGATASLPGLPTMKASLEPAPVDGTLEDDGDEISVSSEESDDEAEKKQNGSSRPAESIPAPTVFGAPLMTERKRAQIKEKIAKARKEWLDTASRLRVEQVKEEVTAGAQFTFDFLFYVLIAAWVAGIGLVTNSSATVVASMLISPMMGPVLGATFGTVVRDTKLIITGLRNEIIALALCILVGMLVFLIIGPTESGILHEFPSNEMTSRGTTRNLIVGVLVAFPSGMAVALSTLGKNSGGLTGVAISLSLLPPAVDAGICWTYALFLRAGRLEQNPDDDTDYAFNGTMAFCLTCINIACIWAGGNLMFKIKEVAPLQQKNTFWDRDLKIARGAGVPNANVINEGIKAALELQEERAGKGELHTDGLGKAIDLNPAKFTAARRRTMASNAVEDAFVLGHGGLAAAEIVPGGAGSDQILNAEKIWAQTEPGEEAPLVKTANKIGGWDQASALLFSGDDQRHDAAIPDEQVVAQLLLSPSN